MIWNNTREYGEVKYRAHCKASEPVLANSTRLFVKTQQSARPRAVARLGIKPQGPPGPARASW
jgi:hypothetical protein